MHALFLVNVGLQLCDGLATYYGVHRGMPEANPLLHASTTQWGVGWALFSWKALACGLLVFLRTVVKSRVLAVKALTLTATVYRRKICTREGEAHGMEWHVTMPAISEECG